MNGKYPCPIGTIIRPEKRGRTYFGVTPEGLEIDKIPSYTLSAAFKQSVALELRQTSKSNTQWKKVPQIKWIEQNTLFLMSEKKKMANTSNSPVIANTHDEFTKMIKSCFNLKPARLKMKELIWRYIIRCAMKGDNLMMLGPSGCGKSMVVYAVAKALNRKLFIFNMGATQDPRGALIGNTHFKPESGTYVAESEFIQAIQTDHAIILLDEISRAHPDTGNILMTVLDKGQRYLRIDEKPGAPIIKVNPTVSFFLTANVGSEYTGTRTMDRALLDRCKIVEVEPLSTAEEVELLSEVYPKLDRDVIKSIAELAGDTRSEVKSAEPKIDTIISTRVTLEMADMIHDGFTFEEAVSICVYPMYSEDGGAESTRSHMKKTVQKYLPVNKKRAASPNMTDPSNPDTPW